MNSQSSNKSTQSEKPFNKVNSQVEQVQEPLLQKHFKQQRLQGLSFIDGQEGEFQQLNEEIILKKEQIKRELVSEEEQQQQQQQQYQFQQQLQYQQQQQQQQQQNQVLKKKDHCCQVEGCNKSYANYASLYTHSKQKHPDNCQMLIPQKINYMVGGECMKKLEGQRELKYDRIVVNRILNNNKYLDFFKVFKEHLQDERESQVFCSERSNFTKLNETLLKEGEIEYLKKILEAVRYQKEKEKEKEEALKVGGGAQNNSSKQNQPNNQNSMYKSASNFMVTSAQQTNLQKSTQILESQENFGTAHSTKDNYFETFYLICQEIIKPFQPPVAIEICYIFDQIIEKAPELKNKTVSYFSNNILETSKQFLENKKSLFPNILKFKLNGQNQSIFIKLLVEAVSGIIEKASQ